MTHIDYTLYLVTDRSVMSAKSLEQAVEQAIQGGCTVVQLREKYASSREFFETAQRVKQITDSYHIPLIINDLSFSIKTTRNIQNGLFQWLIFRINLVINHFTRS